MDNDSDVWKTSKELMELFKYKDQSSVSRFARNHKISKKISNSKHVYNRKEFEAAVKEDEKKHSYCRITNDTEEDSKESIIKWLNAEPLTLSELSRRLDRSKETIVRLLDEIHTAGIDITFDDASKQAAISKQPFKFKEALPIEPFYKHRIKIGCISDLHLGSKQQQLTLARTAYKIFDQEKCDFIVNAGDVFEGAGMHSDQTYESFVHGFDDALQYGIDNYPESKRGIKSYLIGGSHDMSHKKATGANIVRALCKERSDLIYRGEESASFSITGKEWFNINLLHPAGGASYARCFDDETEILTNDGFKFFKDLKDTDTVATLNPITHLLEYQNPTERQVYDWDGDLYHFFGKSFDLVVTPEHSLYLRRSANRLGSRKRKDNSHLTEKQQARYKRELLDTSWKKMDAKDVFDTWKKQLYQMTKTCNWKGEEKEFFDIPHVESKTRNVLTGLLREHSNMKHFGKVKMDDWLEFLGWFISEGHASKYSVTISQITNQQKRKEIFDVCSRLGFTPSINEKEIRISSKEIVSYLRTFIGTNSFNKQIPQLYKNLSSRQIRILVESYLKGDGWKTYNGPNQKWTVQKRWAGCHSESTILLDDFQECLLKIGLSGTKNIKQRTLSISHDNLEPDIVKKPEVVPYVGKVYDVTVPNHIILVRRSGKIIWSGNSYKLQKQTEALISSAMESIRSHLLEPTLTPRENIKVPMILLVGHYHQASYLPQYLGIDALLLPCMQSQTAYLRRKSLFPQVGFVILTIDFDERKNTTRIIPDFRIMTAYTKESDY